ncbi:MAG TPA: GAF domain-containing protein [Terriglobales bacterium]|nr:GAF domain-containing protein [Terriglobales bacterium]
MKTYRSRRDLLSKIDQVLSSNVPTRRRSPLQQVVEVLHEGRHYFWIGIYFLVGNQVVRQVFRGPMPPCHSFALGVGNVGTTGRNGVMKVVPDVSQDPTYSMCFFDTKSEIVVPIKLVQRIFGVIDVESDRLNAFPPGERVLLKQVAERLARFLAVRGKYLLRRAREQAEEKTADAVQRGHQPASEKIMEARRAAAGERSRR